MGVGSMAEALRAEGAPAGTPLAMPAPQRRARGAPRALHAPRRYRVRENASGLALICVEAPTLSVHIERGACVRASAARGAPPGTS